MSGEAAPPDAPEVEQKPIAVDERIVDALAGLAVEPDRCFLCDQIVKGGGAAIIHWGEPGPVVDANAQRWHIEHCFVPTKKKVAP